MNFTFGFANPTIDNWGHLGGLINGFFLIFLLSAPIDANGCAGNYKVWFWISLAIEIVINVGGLALFYTVRKTYPLI